jgi:branched-chain amino acid transport system permease protein
MALALMAVGVMQSWSVALTILNLCLISAVMALGVNIQWGYAGLFNAGIMGFAALGGVAAVVMTMPPVADAWSAGGAGLLMSGALLVLLVLAVRLALRMTGGRLRVLLVLAILLAGYVLLRRIYDPAVSAIEATNPATFGNLGGLGLPVPVGWLAGGVFAAGAAWVVGRISLGLRSDYLAIATLGISEIILAVVKNEDWLARGVKNVTGLPRPFPPEIELQKAPWVIDLAARLGADVPAVAGNLSKLGYAALFALVLLALLWLSQRAIRSPWGRMMRAIRDNETAAEAMGKDVPRRHLQVFVLGSAVVGIAGAMLVTLDGQFTPGSYSPLRYTFLIWVMVIVGGSGNNLGAILGGFLIWFLWIEAEPLGIWLMDRLTAGMDAASPVRAHLIDAAPHLRLFMMGLILLVVMRFAPRGLLPERAARRRH